MWYKWLRIISYTGVWSFSATKHYLIKSIFGKYVLRMDKVDAAGSGLCSIATFDIRIVGTTNYVNRELGNS
jgi:hypothetical protein